MSGPPESERWVHLNGELVPADAARIDPADRGLLLADGLFETMHARGGVLTRATAHAARLAAGATALGMPAPPDAPAMALLAGELLVASGLDGPDTHAAVRLTWTRGPGPRGLEPPAADVARPTQLLTATPLRVPPHAHPPARAVLAPWPIGSVGPLARFKTLGYSERVLARRMAAERGADLALVHNAEQQLVGADAANLFVLLDEVLVTPSVTEGALPGTTRAAVIAAARSCSVPLRSGPVTPAQLLGAQAAFVTSALIGLRALASVDGHAVGEPQRTRTLVAQLVAAM